MSQVSIKKIETCGAIVCVDVENRHWRMSYETVQAALTEAVSLGILANIKEQLAKYEASPADWEIHCRLPKHFDDLVLRDHAWKLETVMDLQPERRFR